MAKSQIAIMDYFNRQHPVGSRVILQTDSGPVITKVRTKAFLSQPRVGTAVAFFEDVSGYYAIEGRVTAHVSTRADGKVGE